MVFLSVWWVILKEEKLTVCLRYVNILLYEFFAQLLYYCPIMTRISDSLSYVQFRLPVHETIVNTEKYDQWSLWHWKGRCFLLQLGNWIPFVEAFLSKSKGIRPKVCWTNRWVGIRLLQLTKIVLLSNAILVVDNEYLCL